MAARLGTDEDAARRPRTLVTGVHGSIGDAIALRLREDGHAPVLVGHAPLTSKGDVNVDFTDLPALSRAVENIASPIRHVVVSHGMLLPGPLERVDVEEWQRMLSANLTSAYAIIRAARPKLGSGSSIVVISSTAAFDHSPVGGPHYTVSKWGLNGLVRHLSDELGPAGIRINAVCPGFVNNPMGHAFLEKKDIDRAIETIPLRRAGRPDEVASVVSFLLGDDASYITGAAIPVSGGFQ
ncbi:MAG: SDR family oxidoreductase [Rhizobiales bacterium]|nr:SDR family oxidoreductase [Hyphomicrobiales bacterium]